MMLQESLLRERETRTILCFLREQMDGVDGARRRRSLKERLGLRGIGCCGSTWGFGATTMRDDEDEEGQREEEEDVVYVVRDPPENNLDPGCVAPVISGSGMNLAAALAAERHFRASHEPEGGTATVAGPTVNNVVSAETVVPAPATPSRVSLMTLLEETTDGGDGEAGEKEREKGGGAVGSDSVCCVCMVRKKGAAFIPCGHTFCRVCTRELWLNRGSCPLCNRSILEILDIF